MRLQRVEIKGFRSISESLVFHARPTLTCLIGANEHGKSNILDAIRKLGSPTFDEYDRYSYSSAEGHPTLNFAFQVSELERRKLVGVLKTDVQRLAESLRALEAESTSDSAEVTRIKNSLRWNSDTLTYYEKTTNRDFTVDVLSDGTLKLHLSHIVYTLKGTPNWARYLGSPLPQVSLFSAAHELADTITLPELEARANLPFEGLLKLAGKWECREELFQRTVLADRHLVEAGKTLTKKLRGIWSQGVRHTFRLSESSGVVRLTIEDPTTFDMPSRRSLGFRSFLALALTLYAETESLDPEGFILLFDEPGIHLHPQGQKDLLRELRRLSEHNQIIYTTHSPFMIDRNDLDATILVRKETVGQQKGTKLVYKPYGANWSSLSAALGVGPSDAFFPPERSLVVEGTSDRAYVAKYMSICAPQLRADLNFLNIIDADRREEMEATARILVSAGRKIVLLSDADSGGQQWKKWIRRIAGAKREQIESIDMGTLVPVLKEVSIEDLLPLDLWIQAVETWLREVLSVTHTVDRKVLQAMLTSQTLGRAMAEYLVNAGVIQRVSHFSKTNVADFFCRSDVPKPSSKEPIFRLCQEIARKLELVRD